MKNILFNITNSPATSVAGACAGLPTLVEGIAERNIVKILAGVGMLLVGLFAKEKPTVHN